MRCAEKLVLPFSYLHKRSLFESRGMSQSKIICISESDSDAEDERNLPSKEECEERCQKFAEVTGTDTALAMFYLQDRDWSVDRSLNDYFADRGDSHTSESRTGLSSQTQASSSNPKTGKASESNNLTYLTTHPPVLQPRNEDRIRILSWNIDGLDPDNLQSRTEGVCSVLLQETPEVIFLQEVVDRSLKIIQSKCSSYLVYPGVDEELLIPGAYFTAMLLRRDCVKVSSVNIADFPTSLMSRNLLEVKCKVKDIAMTMMTSHLESTVSHSAERKKQIRTCFDHMMRLSTDETVIFGGDLNIRDKELTGLSAKPQGVYDMWECSGKRREAQYTWDLTINDNKHMNTKFQPRCRFDRLYIRHAKEVKMTPVYFELVGIQRLASCQRFPSDHWGILAHLDVKK